MSVTVEELTRKSLIRWDAGVHSAKKDGKKMKIMSLLTGHKHYWGIPHERDLDRRMIQTCYECSAEREIRVDLHPSFTEEQRPGKDKLRAA